MRRQNEDSRYPKRIFPSAFDKLCSERNFSCDGFVAKGNKGIYLSFDTSSEKLADSILKSLKSIGIKSYFYKYEGMRKLPAGKISKRTIYCVRIRSKGNINKFMKEIGSINPKQLKNIENGCAGVPKRSKGLDLGLHVILEA